MAKATMKQVDVIGMMNALSRKGSARLSDFATPVGQEPQPSLFEKKFRELKRKNPDAVLLFRVAGYYESYYEDADAVSEVLGVPTTLRSDDMSHMAAFKDSDLDTFLPKLIRAGKRTAIYDEINVNENKEDSTMSKKNEKKTENASVQTAQVTNPSSEVEVAEVQDVVPAKPAAKPGADKPVAVPLGDHGELVVGKPGLKPKAGGYSVETYTTKKGGTAALLFGFATAEDAEAMAGRMAKSISGSWRYGQDKEKRYCLSMGTRYVDVAKALCEALNKGDQTAVDKACKDSVAIYDGVVSDAQAAREAKKKDRQAAKAKTAKAAPKAEKPAPKAEKPADKPAPDAEEQAMYELFKKFMAGDKDAMAKVGAVLKQAA